MPFTDYRITSNYGWRIHPLDNIRKFHAGIDLVKYHRAPIRPFVGGKVVYASEGRPGTGVGGYGNVVAIKADDGTCHVYCHLDSVAVKVNHRVGTNTVIGYQGKTGKVTGSHLHYEIRKKSTPSLGWTSDQSTSTYDPIAYLGGVKRVVTKLKVDGSMGPATIKRLQQFLGVKQDGVISTPTSNMVKELQKFLNSYGQ